MNELKMKENRKYIKKVSNTKLEQSKIKKIINNV